MASSSKPPPESSDQAKEIAETLPLPNLRLHKDDSFMNQVRTALSQKSKPSHPPAQVLYSQANLSDGEKLKAAHVPATLIKIGSWQFASGPEAVLVAKFYFAARKLVWEVHAKGMKNKMEIKWLDISAIRATIEENKPGILEIELYQPPTFYNKTNPQLRHHSIWISADDFTGGQALTSRRHYLEFPSAALDSSYVKLLSSDRRFLEMSQSDFPSSAETTFCTLQPFKHNECPQAQVIYPQVNLSDREKLKAGHVPATLIKIGSWQFVSVPEAEMVAKFYFATRKLVWEVHANGMKNKMEIKWSDISAIRATIEENKPEILEIELYQLPTFYKETNPQPRHHSIWTSADDFTGGQALTSRRHYLEFPSASLKINYIKLLSSDSRLLELSQRGFPSSAKTTFCTLQLAGFENSPMTQVSNNLSQIEALPPLRPAAAAAANSTLYLREHLNSPYVGEAGVPTLQIPAIMRKTEGQLVLDPNPISWYHPGLPPAINSTSTSPIGSSSAAGSASIGDAMGVRQEHDGNANSSGKFIGPSEQNETTSPIGSSSAKGSASNLEAMGEKEHDGC